MGARLWSLYFSIAVKYHGSSTPKLHMERYSPCLPTKPADDRSVVSLFVFVMPKDTFGYRTAELSAGLDQSADY